MIKEFNLPPELAAQKLNAPQGYEDVTGYRWECWHFRYLGVEVPDYDNFLNQPFVKMLVPGEPEKLLKLQEELRAEFGDRAVIFISKPYFLEILPPNCGKGEAVTWLAEHIGIPVETTMGFGDSMNDESMIRMCGYGVCRI